MGAWNAARVGSNPEQFGSRFDESQLLAQVQRLLRVCSWLGRHGGTGHPAENSAAALQKDRAFGIFLVRAKKGRLGLKR